MMNDPEQMKKAIASLQEAVNGGGGLTGQFLRSSAAKSVLDKVGGLENVERMMKDPNFLETVKKTINDPKAMERVAKSMSEIGKDGEKKLE